MQYSQGFRGESSMRQVKIYLSHLPVSPDTPDTHTELFFLNNREKKGEGRRREKKGEDTAHVVHRVIVATY